MKTEKFKALIVDDESDARDLIELMLEDMFPNVEVIGKAEGVTQALHATQVSKPDIIFLDIEMGDGTGFDFLAKLPQLQSLVVFITAYDKYAIDAIKASAFDYVLKPVNKDEFTQTMNKALKKLISKNHNEPTHELTNQQVGATRKIGIPTLTGINFVDIDTVERCEANGNYTTIYFTNAPKVLVSRTLSHFENDLKRHGFLRIHHKHLVNLNLIKSYSKGKGGGYVIMNNGIELEVSARKKTDLIKILSQGEG